MAIILEVLEGKGARLYKFEGEEVTLGRGYDVDVHLTDPYVSANHCSIRLQDGHFAISDNDSLNGIEVENATADLSRLAPGSVLRFGKTRVRLLTPDFPVPAPLPLNPVESALEGISGLRTALFLGLVFACLVLTRQYLQTYQDFDITKQVRPLLQVMVMFSLWPLLFGLLSRLNKNSSRLSLQFSLVWLFALGISLFNYVKQWLHFNLGGESFYKVLSVIGNTVGFAALLWLSLLVAFHQSPRKRNRITAGITLTLVGLSLTWTGLQQQDFNPRPQYQLHLLPPALLVASPTSTEDFVNDSKNVFEQAELLRKETP